ncbi:MAG: hypothetical protein ACRD3V_11670 [Vicinamibacteria bacterium]
MRTYLRRHRIADLPALKEALGTSADLTGFRKLQSLGHLSSYTHRGRFYTLREIARFDDDGLWSHEAVWFSRHGTLVNTLAAWITRSSQGWFADELADRLHVDVQDPLHDLVRQGRLRRVEIGGRFLYTAADARSSKRSDPSPAHGAGSSAGSRCDRTRRVPRGSQSRHSVVLQPARRTPTPPLRRLGIDQIGLRRRYRATFLHLDPHTVARGRQQLLDHDIAPERIRRVGGGRLPVEKKRPTSSR